MKYLLLLKIGKELQPVNWYTGKLYRKEYTSMERLEIMKEIYEAGLSDDYQWEAVSFKVAAERKAKQEKQRRKDNEKLKRKLGLTKKK